MEHRFKITSFVFVHICLVVTCCISWALLLSGSLWRMQCIIRIMMWSRSLRSMAPSIRYYDECRLCLMFCFVQVFWIFASFLKIAPMHVNNVREVPEYEIDPAELDFTNGNDLSKVCMYISLSFTWAFSNWLSLALISLQLVRIVDFRLYFLYLKF